MIRVVQVMPNLGNGGAEHMLAHLVRGLDGSRFASVVISLFPVPETDLVEELSSLGVRVISLRKHLGLDWRTFSRLDQAIRQTDPHIVHTHRYALRYVLPSLYARPGIRAVHTVHNLAHAEVDWPGRMLHRLSFGRRVVPVAVAPAIANSVRAEYGLRQVVTIPNGIPVGHFAVSGERGDAWRIDQGFHERDVLIVSIGRLTEQKNPLLLLEAFDQVVRQDLHTRLLFAGEGELMTSLMSAVVRLGLGGRVTFLGQRSDVRDVLAAADVVVQSSSWEGNPLSLLEAMAAGRAIVATSVGGVPDVIVDGMTGLLVPPKSAGKLADAIARVISDPILRERLGMEAARVARAHYDAQVMTDAYEELYESLLKSTPRLR